MWGDLFLQDIVGKESMHPPQCDWNLSCHGQSYIINYYHILLNIMILLFIYI